MAVEMLKRVRNCLNLRINSSWTHNIRKLVAHFIATPWIACFDSAWKQIELQIQQQGVEFRDAEQFSAFFLIRFPLLKIEFHFTCEICFSTPHQIECPLVDILSMKKSISRQNSISLTWFCDSQWNLIKSSNHPFRLWKVSDERSAVRKQHQHNDFVNRLKWFH